MQWPSNSVPYGGILHPAKSSYSPDTHRLLQVLMDESKLAIRQRKNIDYCLRNGESLPPPRRVDKSIHRKHESEILIRPGPSRRRTKETIVQSGAYDRDKFVVGKLCDREKEKSKLQNRMAYGKDIKPRRVKPPKVQSPKMNRFDQLKLEIQERQEWIEQMQELGEAEQHKLLVEQEIQARIREMEKLTIADM